MRSRWMWLLLPVLAGGAVGAAGAMVWGDAFGSAGSAGAAASAPVLPGDPHGGESASAGDRALMDRAIADERGAIAFYEAVMERHGERPPFSRIIQAERRHEAALLAQYERLGWDPPASGPPDAELVVPDRFTDACDEAALAEIQNAALYGDLLAGVRDAQVRRVFEALRDASQQRHLRAFERAGSGWIELNQDTLTSEQRAQRDRATAARAAVFAALMHELPAAMQSGGPAGAIGVCAERAPAMTASIADRTGVRVGRTSWKLRNPANTGPAWARLRTLAAHPEQPVVLADRAGRLGVLSPIRVMASCLACHGGAEMIDGATRAALAERYPQDSATGFAEGDLRGWFWMEVPAED